MRAMEQNYRYSMTATEGISEFAKSSCDALKAPQYLLDYLVLRFRRVYVYPQAFGYRF